MDDTIDTLLLAIILESTFVFAFLILQKNS